MVLAKPGLAFSIGSSFLGEVASFGSCPKAHGFMLPLAPKSSGRRVICEATYGRWVCVGHIDLCVYSTEISTWQE